MKQILPLSPSQVLAKRKSTNVHYQKMIESVNELLVDRYSGGHAKITQDEILIKFEAKIYPDSVPRDLIFKNGLLDFEDDFRSAGWKVVYEKPDYNGSSFPHYFEFSK